MARILVVEDETEVASFIVDALQDQNYEVVLAEDGESALKAIFESNFDLMVLDVMLPGIDGFEVLREARKAVKTPVLMLTARRRLADRLEGLESGADDYLTKPFKVAEFLARVKAILRRTQLARGVLTAGDLWLDPVARKAKRGKRNLFFSNTEFALLELLCNRVGHPVSKREILEAIWDDADHRDPNLVEVYIGYLRSKLEMLGESRIIHTVRGVGYVLKPVGHEATA